jgi:hypothetical protein
MGFMSVVGVFSGRARRKFQEGKGQQSEAIHDT